MLKIDTSNNISLTRGDTLTLTVALTKDGEAYTPEEGDVIRFALAKEYETDPEYELLVTEVIPNDTLTFTLTSSQTQLPYDTYKYDIQITHPDGCVDTFISAKLTITGEVA